MSKKRTVPKLGGRPFDTMRLKDFHRTRRFLEWSIAQDLEFAGAEFPNKTARRKAIKLLAWNCAFNAVTR